jgi:predicted RNase H-like HicB family nuclease
MEYTAIIEKTPDGWYAAQCAQIPEAITQGRTLEETKENLVDAIELVLQVKKERAIKEVKTQKNRKIIFRRVAVI